ncbi:SH3 domain-containing protein [Jiella sonneratiae]|uniref:SH3 domain-containing protein n=1 Tax=Jiella sonneratiae TaxID=2816856 RepID=A0ABS3J355_9HYPH|nr:SH3 domain-containing protein [Jiella sonneratiae]MBO0903413.1 SH3 domain-containing protein [Jiella sonneratiae]
MRKTLLAATALIGALTLPAGAALASEIAVATTDVNLRAGPSTDYPVVDTLIAGERLRVFGCLQTRSWCDVRFQGQRGWISANYIALRGDGYAGYHDFNPYSAPVITFSVDSYWRDHYASRNFYRDRDRYRRDRDGGRHDRGDRYDRRDRDGRDFDHRDRPRPDYGDDRRHGGYDDGGRRGGYDGDRDRHDRGDGDYRRRPPRDGRVGDDQGRGDDGRHGGYDGRGRDSGGHDGGHGNPRRYPVDPNAGPPIPLYKVR